MNCGTTRACVVIVLTGVLAWSYTWSCRDPEEADTVVSYARFGDLSKGLRCIVLDYANSATVDAQKIGFTFASLCRAERWVEILQAEIAAAISEFGTANRVPEGRRAMITELRRSLAGRVGRWTARRPVR